MKMDTIKLRAEVADLHVLLARTFLNALDGAHAIERARERALYRKSTLQVANAMIASGKLLVAIDRAPDWLWALPEAKEAIAEVEKIRKTTQQLRKRVAKAKAKAKAGAARKRS